MKRSRRLINSALLLLLGACAPLRCSTAPATLTGPEIAAIYGTSQPPPEGPLSVFHLGHSLVGRDMPAMLEQLAPEGHHHASQLGWGTTLKAHWEPDEPITGFDVENAHPRYRDAHEALASGEYQTVVLTEMVEIRASIEYFESWRYLAQWAESARQGNPATRIYLYETWHRRDDPEGWLERLDADLGRYWQEAILWPALATDPQRRPIYVIPAGQVLARFVRKLEARGGVDGIADRADLFALGEDGTPDDIHLSDLGHYLVALTHYAVLYQRDPRGQRHELRRADGSPANAPSAEAAALMQQAVWETVHGNAMTGLPAAR